MDFISPAGLSGAYNAMVECIEALEHNRRYKIKCYGEPQLGKRGLYPTISHKGGYDEVTAMMNFITYADGTNDIVDISDIMGVPVRDLVKVAEKLRENGLVE